MSLSPGEAALAPHFQALGPLRHLWMLRPCALTVAVLAPMVATAAWADTPWTAGLDADVAYRLSETLAQTLATALALAFAAFVVGVELMVGNNARILLLCRSFVRGVMAYLLLAGVVLLCLMDVAGHAASAPPAHGPAIVLLGVFTAALIPLATLLTLSALSPTCVITGVTAGAARLLRRRPPGPREAAALLRQIHAVADYAHHSGLDGGRDAYRLTIEQLADLITLMAAVPKVGEAPYVKEWESRPFGFKWLLLSGDPAPGLTLAPDASLLTPAQLPPLKKNVPDLGDVVVAAISRAMSVELYLAAAGDPALAVAGIYPWQAIQVRLSALAAAQDRRASKMLGFVADAYVMAWALAAHYGIALQRVEVVWRCVVGLRQCVQAFEGVPALTLAWRDAIRALAITGAVAEQQTHELRKWLAAPGALPLDHEARDFVEKVFPEWLAKGPLWEIHSPGMDSRGSQPGHLSAPLV